MTVGVPSELSEASLFYGLNMLEKAGEALRGKVHCDNTFEKKLLSEVVSPEDCGEGFSEVGTSCTKHKLSCCEGLTPL